MILVGFLLETFLAFVGLPIEKLKMRQRILVERKVLQFLGQLCGSHIKEDQKSVWESGIIRNTEPLGHILATVRVPCIKRQVPPKKESSGSLEEWNKNQDMVFPFSSFFFCIFFCFWGFLGAVERLIGVAVGTFIEYFPFETH